MRNLWQKIKSTWTGSLIFSFSLLLIFLVLFYLANLDLKGAPVLENLGENSSESLIDEEIQKRLGSNQISSLDFNSWVIQNNLSAEEKYDGDPDNDKLPNYLEYIHGTDPNNSDTDKDGYSDYQEIINGYDPDASGDARAIVEVSIEKINLRAPMVWSKNEVEKDVLKDLENGVAHYAHTASPGQIGNAVISGHSSNYVWVKGDYNHIFEDLNDLRVGDKITVKVIQKNGHVITYTYAVKDKFITGPDDAEIFAQTDDNSTLTLSTCWPLGTAFRRLIIKAELVK